MTEAITADLQKLKALVEPLVESLELDDLHRGLVGVIPVVGGVFVHPLTREPIRKLRVYGAGEDRVKILEPRFLRSLPRMSVAGVSHPAMFCAGVAKTLSETLSELGRNRARVSAMGITVDLLPDILMLGGKVELQGVQVAVIMTGPDRITVTRLGARSLAGVISRDQRTLILQGQPTVDLDELARLIHRLNSGLGAELTWEPAGSTLAPESSQAAESVPEVLELTETVAESQVAPAWPPPSAPAPEPQAEPAPSVVVQPTPAPIPFEAASPEVAQPAPAPAVPTPFEAAPPEVVQPAAPAAPVPLDAAPPEVVQTAPAPAAPTTFEAAPPEVVQPAPAPAAPTPFEAAPPTPPEVAPPAEAPSEATQPAEAEESMGAIDLRQLYDKLGSEAEIAARGGRLRIVAPQTILKRRYTFYLEQVGPFMFAGNLITDKGNRHRVQFDIREIEDVKEIFDQVMG